MTIVARLETSKSEIIEKYKNGISTNKLADEYGCSAGTIYYFLQNEGVEVKKGNWGAINKSKDVILDCFRKGMSAYAIAKQIGTSKTSVLRFFKKHKIDMSAYKTQQSNKPTLVSIKESVIKDYLEGMGSGEVARKYGYSQSAVSILLRKNGVDMRDWRIDVDEDFFSAIDTEEKAYVLGWMYADGNINKSTWRIQIADLDILEKIKEIVKYKGEIADVPPPKKFPHRKVQYVMNVCRKKMVDDLAKLGVMSKKSLIIKFPSEDQVPKHLLGHFLRGVFDGDGSITERAQGGFSVSLASTQGFLDEMVKLFKSDFHIYERFPERESTSRSMLSGKKSTVFEFLDYIYKDATVYLDRKYKPYKEFLQWYKDHPDET